MKNLKYLLTTLLVIGGTFFLTEFILRFFGYSLLVSGYVRPYTPSYTPLSSWMGGTLRLSGFLYLSAMIVYLENIKKTEPIQKYRTNIAVFLSLLFTGMGVFSTGLLNWSHSYARPDFRQSTTVMILFWLIITAIVWIVGLKKNKPTSDKTKL